MSTLVSIIVPCYKQAHYLKESLRSVQLQSHEHWECIIVNDGSPDHTEEVAQQWCDSDARFRYVSKPNGGLSSARNVGIKNAKGAFILPLDADDILHRDYLKMTVPELENNEQLAIVTCYSNFFEGTIDNIIHKTEPIGTTYHALLFENNIIATSLYRKTSWEQVGGYDEEMRQGFEDWEFWISILKGGKEFMVVPSYLFNYRKAKKSMLTDTLAHHRISNMKYVINKHSELYQKHFDNTTEYLFFLINMYRNTEVKIKSSMSYKVSKYLTLPFRKINSLLTKK